MNTRLTNELRTLLGDAAPTEVEAAYEAWLDIPALAAATTHCDAIELMTQLRAAFVAGWRARAEATDG